MFEWLKYIGNLCLDFYLLEYNIDIEYQGEQHFKPIDVKNIILKLYIIQIKNLMKI